LIKCKKDQQGALVGQGCTAPDCDDYIPISFSESHMSLHDIQDGLVSQCNVYFGYSYLLAWTVFIIYAFAGLAFLMLSKKRKYLKHDFSTTLK